MRATIILRRHHADPPSDASTNYQIQAPEPYAEDVHEDVLADLAKIQGTDYASDYDLHIAVQQAVARLQDGHCVWRNYCFVRFLLVTLISACTDLRLIGL